MAQITDKKISKVYEGKVIEGKGQYFNLYLEGGKNKYGYFVAKGKTAPAEGMKIALMEWETTEKDGYTNNKVTKLVWLGADHPTVSGKAPDSRLADKNSPIWFCLSYAKDLQAARIQTGQTDPNKSLEELGLEVALVAVDMLRFIEHPVDLAKDKKVDTEHDAIAEAQAADVSEDDIPF
ncbi:MAG: hypothetical protein H7831_18470 [Magnetococcus sp. WYHC-3]